MSSVREVDESLTIGICILLITETSGPLQVNEIREKNLIGQMRKHTPNYQFVGYDKGGTLKSTESANELIPDSYLNHAPDRVHGVVVA